MLPGIGPIVISQRTVRRLVLVQSVLSGLQVVAAASTLGDVLGVKYFAIFIVLVAAAQQGVNTYISKSVGEAVSHVDRVVTRAEQVTEHASDTVTALAAAMPAQSASRALLEENERKRPDG